MTKAFLETTVLKPENEKFVIEAFSKDSIKKVREFNLIKRVKLKKTSDRKLSISDLSVLS